MTVELIRHGLSESSGMKIVAVTVLSFFIDLLLGDPAWLPHPVVLMGRAITGAETVIRKHFPKTPAGEQWGGFLLALLLPVSTLAISGTAVFLLHRLHPLAGFALQVLWGWQALALRAMITESRGVYRKLTEDSLESARRAVARIVGRDTSILTREGVVKAAVESVAESFSDGLIAPMLFLIIGGAPLALTYKAINTMDSMIGYKNDRYLHFGHCAARLDDAANFVPSRLSALLLIASAFLCGQDGKGAFMIWRRDRKRHASPNAAQTESVMAGALGVELGGPAVYFGKTVEKPVIGEALRSIVPADILRANRMFVLGGCLGIAVLCVLRTLFVWRIGRW